MNKIKKTILLGIASFCFIQLTTAQMAGSSQFSQKTGTRTPHNEKVKFGVRTGMNLSTMSIADLDEEESTQSVIGYHAGFIVDIPVIPNFYIQPGFYITNKGMKEKYEEVYRDEKYVETLKYNLLYMQIPVLASYRIPLTTDIKWHIEAGPYFGIGLAGKWNYKDEYEGEKESGTDNIWGDDGLFKRFDSGLSFGTGISFQNIYFGLSYEVGLANISSDSDFSIKNRCFMISTGMTF